MELSQIPEKAVGLRLCKVDKNDDLICCEPIRFERGRAGVQTTLSRARVAGAIGPIGETGDFWADILDNDGDWFETIALSREAWNSLKNRWMRCKIERFE